MSERAIEQEGRKQQMSRGVGSIETEIDHHKRIIAEKEARLVELWEELIDAKKAQVPEPEDWKYVAFSVQFKPRGIHYSYVGIRVHDGRWLTTKNHEFADWDHFVEWLRQQHAVSPIRKLEISHDTVHIHD